MPSRPHLKRTPYEFLLAQVQAGTAFTYIALREIDLGDAADESKIIRNTDNARTAYDTALRFRDGVVMDEAAAATFETALNQLRNNLHDLGETV